MNKQEIMARAKAVGVNNAGRLRKGDLVRRIQGGEGNQACFGIDWRFSCCQADCCWREDCLTDNPG